MTSIHDDFGAYKFAYDSVINTVKIKAQDPNSVTASIVDYILND